MLFESLKASDVLQWKLLEDGNLVRSVIARWSSTVKSMCEESSSWLPICSKGKRLGEIRVLARHTHPRFSLIDTEISAIKSDIELLQRESLAGDSHIASRPTADIEQSQAVHEQTSSEHEANASPLSLGEDSLSDKQDGVADSDRRDKSEELLNERLDMSDYDADSKSEQESTPNNSL
jgi:hypothetical protein